MRPSLAGSVLAFAATVALASAPAPWAARGDEIVRLVREHFLDAAAAERWVASHAHYGETARDDRSFAVATRAALAELRTSHTGYYTRRDAAYYALRSIFGPVLKLKDTQYDSAGLDVDDERFVRVVFAGGPADAAGIRRGDRILHADGRPFDPVSSFAGKAGRKVTLQVQRTAGGKPFDVAVVPRRLEPRDEWLAAQEEGTRLVQRGELTVAYVPMYSCAGDEYVQALQDAIAGRLAGASALVIDFRGGWGGCSPEFVNAFQREVPVLTSIARNGERTVHDRSWRKPVALLVDGGTRSGKEVVAYALRKHGLATLVGGRTAGAVVAGRCFPLSDGSLLYLAVSDVLVDGERLEGRGVEPDVPVDAALEYANGTDPQLDEALARIR